VAGLGQARALARAEAEQRFYDGFDRQLAGSVGNLRDDYPRFAEPSEETFGHRLAEAFERQQAQPLRTLAEEMDAQFDTAIAARQEADKAEAKAARDRARRQEERAKQPRWQHPKLASEVAAEWGVGFSDTP
jgi:hypothetical protein